MGIQEKKKPRSLPVVLQTGIIITEISIENSQKAKNKSTI